MDYCSLADWVYLAILKKPLHTNIAVEMDEFDDVEVQDKIHIIISVKDFRAILQHAQLTSGDLTTTYSDPGRPMKLSYSRDGIICDFILMTVGEKDAITQRHKNPRGKASDAARSAQPAQPGLDPASRRASSVTGNNANQSASQRPQQQAKTPTRPLAPRQPGFEIRPPPVPPPGTARSESLFVQQDDDPDRMWDPVNPDEEDEEEATDNSRLEWNAINGPVLLPYSLCSPISCIMH